MTRSPESWPLSAPKQEKPSLSPDFVPHHSEPRCQQMRRSGRGEAHLARDRSHCPHHYPEKPTVKIEARVCELRRLERDPLLSRSRVYSDISEDARRNVDPEDPAGQPSRSPDGNSE